MSWILISSAYVSLWNVVEALPIQDLYNKNVIVLVTFSKRSNNGISQTHVPWSVKSRIYKLKYPMQHSPGPPSNTSCDNDDNKYTILCWWRKGGSTTEAVLIASLQHTGLLWGMKWLHFYCKAIIIKNI